MKLKFTYQCSTCKEEVEGNQELDVTGYKEQTQIAFPFSKKCEKRCSLGGKKVVKIEVIE